MAMRLRELLTKPIPLTTRRLWTHRGLSHSVVSEGKNQLDGENG
jgi:hypothetical protein